MYTVLGATGQIGSVIARKLLEKGEKVRVVGRNAARLHPLILKGAEGFVGSLNNSSQMARAFEGSRAAFLMIPSGLTSPNYRQDQERCSDAISNAAKKVGLAYAVNLSSIGAQAVTGSGPVLGEHNSEQQLNAIDRLNVLHLRPAYFFENHLAQISMVQMLGIFGGALKPDMKIPMIAAKDVGAYAAERLWQLDFNGKSTQELLGERDLSMNEIVAVLGKALNKPDLRYAQFPYDQVEEVLVRMGTSGKTATALVELFRAINDGVVAATETRSAKNQTPTSIETFMREVFVPTYQSMAVGA